MQVIVSDNPRARAIAAALTEAGTQGPDDLTLVLGGDGTMLRAISAGGHDRRYLGVNCGYLGFLMNDLPAEPAAAAEQLSGVLARDDWFTTPFPRLRVRIEGADGSAAEGRAMNDVYVERSTGQTCHLRVTVDGVVVVQRVVCDGLIVATALGSTAYSFSAGGPATHPLVKGIQLTAICPHAPRLAPLVLPDTATIRVEVLDRDSRRARTIIDGAEHGDTAAVDVSASGDTVNLGFFTGHDFTATLIRKIIRS